MPIPQSWLKSAVINTNKPKDSIINVLRKRLGGHEDGRDRGTVHASDITKPHFCPRHWAFLDMKGKELGEPSYVPTALQITYDIGRMTAKLLVEEWAGDTVWGNWRCIRCGQHRTMCKKPTDSCKDFKSACIWEYQEVAIEAPEYGFSGSFDALFDVGVPKLLITEIKIMKPEDWEVLLVPLPEHRLRTNLYMKLLAASESPYKDKINLHEARVLYISRAYGKKHPEYQEVLPLKEFVVERNDGSLHDCLKRVQKLKVFRETKVMPSGICNTALDKYAKLCSSCKECFSGQH